MNLDSRIPQLALITSHITLRKLLLCFTIEKLIRMISLVFQAFSSVELLMSENPDAGETMTSNKIPSSKERRVKSYQDEN